MMKLNAKQLRAGNLKLKTKNLKLKKNAIYIVLDNVLDTYNIGSIFRLADALSAKKVYLCGETEIPPNHRIKKASINTTEWVDWQYFADAKTAIENLKFKIKNLQVIAVEQSPKSIQYNKFEYKMPLCLIVGHETTGISKKVLNLADAIVELPMFGVNKSLNVMVSLGIVLYEAIPKTSKYPVSGA